MVPTTCWQRGPGKRADIAKGDLAPENHMRAQPQRDRPAAASPATDQTCSPFWRQPHHPSDLHHIPLAPPLLLLCPSGPMFIHIPRTCPTSSQSMRLSPAAHCFRQLNRYISVLERGRSITYLLSSTFCRGHPQTVLLFPYCKA